MSPTPPNSSPSSGGSTLQKSTLIFPRLPLIIALILLLAGGIFLLHRADAQARDTIRKHHLEDIEQAIHFARGVHGTYPPYDQPTWCGRLDNETSEPVRQQIEDALRAQNEKYANPDKPFPIDPTLGQGPARRNSKEVKLGSPKGKVGYFYWKHSPASFELFSQLETRPMQKSSLTAPDSHQVRDMSACPNDSPAPQSEARSRRPDTYNYSLTSVWREK